jgi:hypothetical protein
MKSPGSVREEVDLQGMSRGPGIRYFGNALATLHDSTTSKDGPTRAKDTIEILLAFSWRCCTGADRGSMQT